MENNSYTHRYQSYHINWLDVPLDNGYYIGGKNCTLEDIKNDDYSDALIRASYNLTEPWIIHE